MTRKQILTLIGVSLVIASLYFIALQIWDQRQTLLNWRPTAPTVFAFILATVFYAAANFTLSSAWIRLLGKNNRSQPAKLHSIYGKSQIGKYLPGNVLHIAGRHILGKAIGLSHTSLISAAIYEILGLISASAIVATIGSYFLEHDIALLDWLPLFAPLPIIAYLVSPWLITKFKPDIALYNVQQMLMPFALYSMFFLVAGGSLAILTYAINTNLATHFILGLFSVFAISWIIGFVTPGAPSGIGIREATLVLLLSPQVGQDNALLIALLFRLVTLFGDIIFMLVTNPSMLLISRKT